MKVSLAPELEPILNESLDRRNGNGIVPIWHDLQSYSLSADERQAELTVNPSSVAPLQKGTPSEDSSA
jgi:hypothetical protein